MNCPCGPGVTGLRMRAMELPPERFIFQLTFRRHLHLAREIPLR